MSSNSKCNYHFGKVDVSPEEAGYNPGKLDQLDAHLIRLMDEDKLQGGSYLLSRYGKIFAWKSMGRLCGYEERGDLMPNSIRATASNTKAFTAIAIMKLVEEGKIYVDQPIATLIDEFNNPMHNKITIFHLLTHTSGIGADPLYFSEPYPRRWWTNIEDISWIKAILSGPMKHPSGEQYSYFSAGYCILGEIISRVSGISYKEYIIENIIKPLEMTRTFFDVPENLYGEVCLVTQEQEKYLKNNEDNLREIFAPAGGMYSTLYDLWKVGQMLLNKGHFNGKRILGRKTVEAMTRNHLTGVTAYFWGDDLPHYEYGLGLEIYFRDRLFSLGTFGHEGAGRIAMLIDPVEEFVAIFMVPSAIGWVPPSMISTKAVIWSGIV